MFKLAVGLAASIIALANSPAQAQSADAFFKNKTLTYIVATSPGGGYDTYGRLIARFMTKQMPQGAKIIVKNVPGAGHIVGADETYVARPDGLTLGTFNTGLIIAQLIKMEGIRFDLAKMSWIGKAASDARVMILSKSSGLKGWKDLTDFTKPPAKFYAGGAGSAAYVDVKLMVEALHLNVTLVAGFNGNEGEMSVLRGETVGTIGTKSSVESFVRDGNAFYALEVGGAPGSTIPQATDFVTNDRDRHLMAMIAAESVIGRLTAGPPAIPPDRLELLRSAYAKTLQDPDLLAEAKKLDIPIEPLDGPQTEKVIKDAMDQSPDTVQFVASLVQAK
jgi:tripartite-type tricarboxylate transporter receptor subunit TctC